MPQFQVELSDGRIVDVESGSEPTHEQLMSALGSWEEPQAAPAQPQLEPPSWLGQAQAIASNPFTPPAGFNLGQSPNLELPEDNGKGRLRSAGESLMQAGGVGMGQSIAGSVRLLDAGAAAALEEAAASTGSRELYGMAEQVRGRTPQQKEADIAGTPLYKFGQELAAGAKEAFVPNPKYRGEFLADVIPSAAGQMVPTVAAGMINPALAAGQYGLSSGQQGAEESIAKGDIADVDKVFFSYLGLGALSELALGVPANILKYAQAARKAGVGKAVAKETILKALGKGGAHEAGQEGLEQLGQNLVAQQTFEPGRKTLEGVPESMAAGFLLGGAGAGVAAGVGAIGSADTQQQPGVSREGISATVQPPIIPTQGVPNEAQSQVQLQTQQPEASRPSQVQERAGEIVQEQQESRPEVGPEFIKSESANDLNAAQDRMAAETDLSRLEEMVAEATTEAKSLAKATPTEASMKAFQDASARVQFLNETIRKKKEATPLNPGGALKDLSPELQAKSNAVKDQMKAEFDKLKAAQAKPEKASLDDLEVAINLNGKPITGGGSHMEIGLRDGDMDMIEAASKPENQGFKYKGKFISREKAAELIGEKLPLTSERLTEMREKAAPASAPKPSEAVAGETLAPAPSPDLVSRLEALKFKADKNGKVLSDGPTQVFSLPHPDAVYAIGKQIWNDSLTLAVAAVKAGKAVAAAIEDALAHIRAKSTGPWDEAQTRANLESALGTLEPTKSGAATGLKHAVDELERISYGFKERSPQERQNMAEAWVRAGETISKNPRAGLELAQALIDNPKRGLTGDESALILRHKTELQNAVNTAAEKTFSTDPETKTEGEIAVARLTDELKQVLDAVAERGSEWGREGRWRQALAYEDFTFATQERLLRASKGGEPLTNAERNKLLAEIETHKAKVAELERKQAQQQQQQIQADVADTVATVRTQSKKDKAAGKVRDLDGEQKAVIDHLKEQFIENDADLTGETLSIRKLMELLVEREGITDRLKMEDRVHEILQTIDPTLTREGAMDLMSGYGKSRLPNPEFAKRTVRDINAQILSVRKLLDYFKGQRPKLTGQLRDAPSQIQRDWQKMVNEAKKAFHLEDTGDNAKLIKSAVDAINTRLKNRIKDLRQEVVTRQKIIRERNPTPYNAETLRLRKELEEAQKAHVEIFGEPTLTDAQRLDRVEKATERQIVELQRQIDSGEIFPKTKQVFGLRSDKLDAAKARLEELKLTRQFARESIQPRPEREATQNEARVRSLDRQIASIEKQLADDAVFSKTKKPRTPSEDARILERENRLEALKQERKFARERNQPKLDPHEAFALNYLLRLRQRAAAYNERAAIGDFAKKERPVREMTPDLLKALAEVEQSKQNFYQARYEAAQKLRSLPRKIWDGIRATKDAFVNIVSAFDLSAPRQMFLAMMANANRMIFPDPVAGAKLMFKPLGKMFEAWASESKSAQAEQRRKNRPNALSGADKKAGIQYTELHTTDFTKGEENARSILDEWAKLPFKTGNPIKSGVTAPVKAAAKGVRMSNRAFITALNEMRADLFDHLLKVNYRDRAPTDADLRTVGNLVNVSTGRGKLGRGVAAVTGQVLWSPSLLASRLQVLMGQPLWTGLLSGDAKGSFRARKIVAKEYARWLISGAALYAISRMFSDDDEAEITSSDAGKVVRGNTRIDPWAGFQQPIVAASRIVTGESTSIEGKARDINAGEVIWNFFKNKTRPDIVAAVKVAIAAIDSGKDDRDVRVTPGEAARAIVPLPLAVTDVIAVMREQGMAEGAIIQVLSEFGVGVSNYEERERQK